MKSILNHLAVFKPWDDILFCLFYIQIPNISSCSNTSVQALLFLFKHSLFPSSCSCYIFLSLSWNVDFCGCLEGDKHPKSELFWKILNMELSNRTFCFLSLFFSLLDNFRVISNQYCVNNKGSMALLILQGCSKGTFNRCVKVYDIIYV